MDKQEFLIHFFMSFVQTFEELSEYTVPQWIPSKAQEKFLEEVGADLLKRSRKDLLPVIHDLPVMEKPPASRILRVASDPTHIFDPLRAALNTAWRLSLTRNQFLSAFNTFYSAGLASGQLQLKDVPHRLYELDITESELQSFLQARHFADIALDVLSHYNDRENSAAEHPLPGKEDGTSPEEGKPQQGVDTAKPQALKELEDSVEEKFKSSEDTSDVFNIPLSVAVSLAPAIHKASQKGVSHEEIKQALQQKAQALPKEGVVFSQRQKQEEVLQPPDLSEIPLYRGRRGRRKQGSPPEVRPLDFLETHYGQYLSAFGAEENIVFQDNIRAHDPKLIQGVKNQLRREGKGRKVSDFVKTRSARLDRELENVSDADLKKTRRLASTLYSRETRAAKAKAAAPARSVTRK